MREGAACTWALWNTLTAEAERRFENRPLERSGACGKIMGLLDFLISLFSGGEKIDCPDCGTAGARKTHEGLIHCKNPSCKNFDAGLAYGGRLLRRYSEVPTRGHFQPEHPISIRYINFVGQERNFSAERDSLVRKHKHIVARVAPTGQKIALSRERIQNLSEVETYLPNKIEPGQNWPRGRELQILNYHKKHGTTSPRYEQLREKYPNW